jgi:hypothetical protein
MKVSTIFKIGLAGSALAVVFWLLVMDHADSRVLEQKISHYESVADSLRNAVEALNVNVHHKDSILLVYLASLDNTLEELNKESFKNKLAIRANFIKQDSIRARYCEQMSDLQQKPDECHCD